MTNIPAALDFSHASTYRKNLHSTILIDSNMRPDRRAILLFLAGVVIMTAICFGQVHTDLVHGSVYYILLGFYGLWMLRHYRYLFAIGIIATVAMTIGYILGPEHSPGALINRGFSIVTVWIGVLFTMRFSKLQRNERKQKKQLNALFENVSEAILLIDSEGKVRLGNPGAERILGYTLQELEGMQIENLLPERSRKNHDQQRKLFTRKPGNRQIGIGRSVFALTKTGKEVPVEISLSSYFDSGELFIIAFVTDITRRKEQEAKIAAQYEEMQQCNLRLEETVKFRTSELEIINQNLVKEIEERTLVEEQLRKSQLLYKAIANNFPDGIIGVLDKNLRYVFVEGKELAAMEVSHKIGEPVFNDAQGSVIKEAEEKLRTTFEGGNVSFELATASTCYDVIATPFTTVNGQVTEALVVIRNITRHKKFEEDLMRSLEKERQLNVLKSRFVTSVSHEFRTPLSTILSSVFLLENYSGADEEVFRKTHTNRIKRSVNSLTELLDDFLSLGKLEEGKVKVIYSEFYLREYLDELISELNLIKKKDQSILLTYIGEDEMILLDKTLLTNILSNLMSNAIKYSPPDGLIEIRAEIRGNMINLSVRDSGMGIPENEQKHIFKRFFRAHNAVNIQGTGLGLNLVRKYVRLMKGYISFNSRLNQGSTFTVNLPVAVSNQFSTSNTKVYA
jgi:PAS domain S-box-containing protein